MNRCHECGKNVEDEPKVIVQIPKDEKAGERYTFCSEECLDDWVERETIEMISKFVKG